VQGDMNIFCTFAPWLRYHTTK